MLGEIDALAIRDLTYIVGHDKDNLAGKFPLPARIRGTIDISTQGGTVVLGSGTDDTTRDANFIALQAALDYADASGKYVDVPTGRYEAHYTGMQGAQKVGLQIKAGIPGVRGDAGSVFAQYSQNHPILTIGETTVRSYFGEYQGLSVVNGVDQTGQVDSAGIQLGAMTYCYLDKISVQPYSNGAGAEAGYFDPYDGMKTIAGTIWSNKFQRINIGGGKRNLLRWTADGTGSKWDVLYCGGHRGGARIPALIEAVVRFENTSQMDIDQMNIEWTEATSLFLSNAKLIEIKSLHHEGNKLPNVFHPSFFRVSSSELLLTSLQVFDPRVANGEFTGTAAMFSHFGRTVLNVKNMGLRVQAPNGFNDVDWHLNFNRDDEPLSLNGGAHAGVCKIEGIYLAGAQQLVLDPKTPKTSHGNLNLLGIGEYNWNYCFSTTERLWVKIPGGVAATYAMYGAHRHTAITIEDPIIGAKTIQLRPELLAGSGIGSAVQRERGDTVSIHREATATGAFNVVVTDGTNVIENIAENTTSPGTRRKYVWNGTSWNAYA
ncbi:hypothetical protein [Flaviflagellibacter deserti]|uniref:Pectate lyase superfamily protein domain-containing protein n=1 Tax=Flaviflagellibacter deserti TaxID=2267266 RepID=A0ABV9Z381_9HYPH